LSGKIKTMSTGWVKKICLSGSKAGVEEDVTDVSWGLSGWFRMIRV
jgi:hypothetical protein